MQAKRASFNTKSGVSYLIAKVSQPDPPEQNDMPTSHICDSLLPAMKTSFASIFKQQPLSFLSYLCANKDKGNRNSSLPLPECDLNIATAQHSDSVFVDLRRGISSRAPGIREWPAQVHVHAQRPASPDSVSVNWTTGRWRSDWNDRA